jgi:glyoxylase-like metal-dependent hydrolase (beta-lactamase superfamily II)
MQTLAAGMSYFDALFQGVPRIIAPALLHGPGGAVILDPGPSSTLATVRAELDAAGLRIADLTAILLTHIHLDHAGATGTLVRENPRIRVFVHEKGAPHMADPAKLLASAARLYGDAMERLWGAFEPVPRDAMVVLRGGERLEAGGRTFDVAYTPGHASHHVSYFSADTGIAFVGDTAGVKLRPDAFVMPATPPPDVDLELWSESFRVIDAWRPDTVFLTHFGPSSPPGAHFTELRDHLESAARLVEQSLAREESDEAREAWFTDEVRRMLARLSASDAQAYELAARFDLSWRGLARYFRTKKGVGQLR